MIEEMERRERTRGVDRHGVRRVDGVGLLTLRHATGEAVLRKDLA